MGRIVCNEIDYSGSPLVTDSTPNASSVNPVTSAGVHNALVGQEGLLKDTVGFTSKNLIPFPSFTQDTVTIYGITFVNNHDGSVTISGTNDNTDTSNYTLLNQSVVPEFWNGLKNIPLILSGGISSDIFVLFWSVNTGTKKDTGNGANILFTDSAISENYNIAIGVAKGTTIASPITVYPMLRKADIMDDTYEQYHIPGVVSQEAQNVLGAKNLNKYPYRRDIDGTRNGITWSSYSDGSVKANGTSTNFSDYNMHPRTIMRDDSELWLPKGRYILSLGADKTSNIYGYVGVTYNNAFRVICDSIYDKKEFVIDDSILIDSEYKTSDGKVLVGVYLGVTANKIVDNVTFHPMIYLSSVKDETWVPFAKTNRDLTESIYNLLGESGLTKRLDNTYDLDNFINFPTGFYYWSTPPSHSPENISYAALINIVRTINDAKQLVFSETAIYVRSRGGDPGSWGNWTKFTGTVLS